MILLELLDTTPNFEILLDKSGIFEVRSKIGKRTIDFNAFQSKIVLDNKVKWGVEFIENGYDYKLTGSGNEFKVFAFIKKCMEMLIEKHKPDIITFLSDKGDKSRTELYKRLLNKFLTSYNFTIIDVETSESDYFKLERK